MRRRTPITVEGPDQLPVEAKAIYKNLLLAPDGVWAWFRMGAIPWKFRSPADRATILDAATIRLADLAGTRIHVRRTAHPVPYNVWARKLDKATPHPLEVPEGAPTWADYLRGAQNRIAQTKMEDPATYIGVRISTAKFQPHELGCIDNPCKNQHPEKIVKAHRKLLAVTTTVSKEGFAAQPVNARVLGWLLHASIGLGVPVSVSALAGSPDEWSAEDLAAAAAPVHVAAAPLSKTLPLRALRDGREYHRHVAVLSVGRMNDRLDTDSPAFSPWLSASDALPFPVEWSWVADVVAPQAMTGKATFFRRRAESILSHYAEHDETPPPAVSRGISDAIRIEDEITDGEKEVAVRLVGPIRCAVAAATEVEALEHVAAVQDHYSMTQRITLVHSYGQFPMFQEFTPGNAVSAVGFQRVMPAYYAATAVPNATTRVGDGEGPYLGRAGHRAVMFDPQWGPRHRKSGLVVCAGGLGSGKSTLAGSAIETSVRRGHQTVVFDPSGPMARLCDMPALAPHSRHVELSGAEPGTLNPFWLIPEPVRAHSDSDKEHEAAIREANAERRDLIVDALSMLLPERSAGNMRAIERAVGEVGGEYATNPWRVIHALEKGNDEAREVGAQLRDVSDMKGARLIFPMDEDARTADARALTDTVLTVITMRGIVTPPAGTARNEWTRAERMAVPVLHLAARYAMRAMYANRLPKLIVADETGIIAAGASTFRSFLTRGARDTRKTNTSLWVLSQNPVDLLELAPQIGNLIGAGFMGRMDDEEAARAALSILGVPDGHQFEKVLTRGYETGDFLMRDWNRQVDTIHADLDWRPDLLDHLNTTPVQELRADDTDEPSSWTDELVPA